LKIKLCWAAGGGELSKRFGGAFLNQREAMTPRLGPFPGPGRYRNSRHFRKGQVDLFGRSDDRCWRRQVRPSQTDARGSDLPCHPARRVTRKVKSNAIRCFPTPTHKTSARNHQVYPLFHHRTGRDSHYRLGPRRFGDTHNLDLAAIVCRLNLKPTVRIENGEFVSPLEGCQYGLGES
jgi:hypothetical protein